ncbi:MAG: tail fiber domain-containing protein [Bacteroidota bacterium]
METMKTPKLLLLIAATIFQLSLLAQAPQKFSYQAVVKNASNNLVTNHAVGLKLSILNASGTVVYCETQTPVTNANGLISVEVGAGTVISGTMAGIAWSSSTYSLKSEIDPSGGTSYSITGTSSLLSVPYALHAKTVENAFSGSYTDLTNKPTLATVATSGSYADLTNKPAIANTQWTTTGSNIYYNTGSVGIGTMTPTAKIDVSSPTEALRLIGDNNYLTFYNSSNTTRTAYIQQNAGTNLDISTNNLPLILNQNGGNVGIGTTAPSAKLSVLTTTEWGGMKIKGGTTADGATIGLSNSNGLGNYSLGVYGSANTGSIANNFYVYDNVASAVRMTVASTTGNVGIGTTSPAYKLDVFANVNATYAAQILNNSSAGSGLSVSAGGNPGNGSNKLLSLKDGGSNEKITVLDNGYVGIGTTSPTNMLTINGSATSQANVQLQYGGVTKGYFWYDSGSDFIGVGRGSAGNSITLRTSQLNYNSAYCTGTTWVDASDARLKRDIQPMTNYGLSTVMQLKPVTYYFKADKSNHHEVGFIAQEMLKIVPEVVSGTEGDISKGETLGLSYGNLVPVLTKAIQEQQTEITDLKKQLAELKAMLIELKNK